MRLLPTYEQYRLDQNTIYRSTSAEFIINWIKQGTLVRPDRFFSFSFHPDSGTSDDFGPCQMVCNRDAIERENELIEVYYDPDFFESHPEICEYVTGYKSEQDYYANQEGRDELDVLDWETYLEDYSEEQELVVPEKLVYNPDMIREINCSESASDDLQIELTKLFFK